MATKLALFLACSFLCCWMAAARLGPSCHLPLSAFSFPNLASHLPSLTFLSPHHHSRFHIPASHPLPDSSAFFFSHPIHFLLPFRSPRSISFSSSFSFTNADGLAFLIAPTKDSQAVTRPWLSLSPSKTLPSHLPTLPRTLAIELDPSMKDGVQDPTGNRLGLDIDSLISESTANVSDSASSDDGGRLFAWIDYRAPMKVVEVRLSKFESQRPEIPILSYSADLSNVWSKEMFVGFSSSNENSPQKHIIYSWSFAISDSRMQPQPRHPAWLGPLSWHGGRPGLSDSRPASRDGQQHPLPQLHFQPSSHNDSWLQSMSDAWRIVIALLFGATCGAVVAASMLVLWSFIRRCATPADEDDDFGMLYGYQQLATPESDVNVDTNDYQKLPSKETEGNTDSI